MNLNDLPIDKPCCESWDEMRGTASHRFCDLCRKEVVNLSALSRDEVAHLFRDGARPCVRYTYDGAGGIVFVHPQVRRQRRGLERLVATAALVLPLALFVPGEADAVEPIFEADGQAILVADEKDEECDDHNDECEEEKETTTPRPRPQRIPDETYEFMGEPAPPIDLLR